MANVKAVRRIQKASKTSVKNAKPRSSGNNYQNRRLPVFLAGFAGAALAIAFMMLTALSVMKNELANQATALNQKVLAMTPASDRYLPAVSGVANDQCSEPLSSQKSQASSSPLTQQAVAHPNSNTTKPSSSNTSHDKYISHLFGNLKASNTGSNSYTGAGSTNTVTAINKNTTTITNDNDINVTNNNSQSAHSGNVSSSQNTTTGNTTSGNATNNSDASFIVKIDND